MMLADNVNLLKRRYVDVYKRMKQIENQLDVDKYEIVATKTNEVTLKIPVEDKQIFLHSKYDPYQEAEQWIKSQETRFSDYDHIFIYGFGLGYHVELLAKTYPDKNISVYEPNPSIFYAYASNKVVNSLNNKRIKNLYVEYIPATQPLHLEHFTKNLTEKVALFIHPVYERLFKEQTHFFIQSFKKMVLGQKSHVATTTKYEKLWIVNGLSNFTKVLETPSIFRLDQKLFAGKPAILVGAGPSLQDEIENLRKIKEEGSAYIFAIGSANKALLANDILPDAVTTYDPNTHNILVFEEMINRGIKHVPMIFGSSVGYSTINHYEGPKLHMITNQDPLANYLLEKEKIAENNELILDAPTIAVITLQMLMKLKCNPIILVGQNFAFKNDQYYASGIKYSYRTEQLTDGEKENLITVESVEGGTVPTLNNHNMGRLQMESYLANHKGSEVINATRGGAKISGTTFQPLGELMETRLKAPVVIKDWHIHDGDVYDLEQIKLQAQNLFVDYEKAAGLIDDNIKQIKRMNLMASNKESSMLAKAFPKLDKTFKALEKNKFYELFIRPMVRIQYEFLQKEIIPIRLLSDPVEKGKKAVEVFGSYIYEVQKTFLETHKLYKMLHQVILLTEPKTSVEAGNEV